MKIYHMIVEPLATFPDSDDAKNRRREYLSRTQGAAPDGYRCIGVCGYHETPAVNADGSPDMRDPLNRK